MQGWAVNVTWIDGITYEYRTFAGSSTAAIRKVIITFRKEKNKSEIRLGQGTILIAIGRTHKKEIERWVKQGKNLVN